MRALWPGIKSHNPWLNSMVFGERLALAGEEVASGISERAIYLGTDEYVYEILASREGEEVVLTIASKRTLADYFRFLAKRLETAGGFADRADLYHRAALRLLERAWGEPRSCAVEGGEQG